MNKSSHPTKRGAEQKALKGLLPLLLPSFEEVVSKGVKEHLDEMKRVWLESLMQAEVVELVGGRHARNGAGPKRWGYERGTAVVDGGKIEVTRPRVRFARWLGEAKLKSYSAMNRTEMIDGPLTQALLAGVSTRAYARIVSRNLQAKGIKKSSVSRRMIAATRPVVDAFLKKDLSKLDR